jgi:hypothetical protein
VQETKIINEKTEGLELDIEKPSHVNKESKLLPKNICETKEKKSKDEEEFSFKLYM